KTAKDEKFFYKDTSFVFNEFKFEFTKNISTVESFKTTLVISNPTDKFMLINPWEVFASADNVADKFNVLSKNPIVVPAKGIKKITLRFRNMDFRANSVSIDFSKIQITGDAE